MQPIGLGRTTYSAFDELGNLVERVDGAGVHLRMEHDASGRVVRRTSPGGAGTSAIDDRYRFDGFGRLVVARNAHTTLTFGYDDLDRPVSMTDPVSGTAQLRYDADGRKTFVSYPSRGFGAVDSAIAGSAWSYDALGRELNKSAYGAYLQKLASEEPA